MKEPQDTQSILNNLAVEYSAAEDYLKKVRDNSDFSWEQKEKVASGLLASQTVNKNKSRVNSNSLLNLVIDQASRVMAQLPTGKVKAIDQADSGKSYLMQCVLEKYILPKANSQWDMLTKFRMIEMYSLIYGSMPALVTYTIKPNYIGPDLEILHPRNVRVQAHKYSIEDADYVFVNTLVPMSFLTGILKREETVYNKEAVKDLLEACKDRRPSIDEEDKTYEQKQDYTEQSKGQIALTTKYSKNRWIVYSREHNIIIRDSKNPNEDGELPVVMKYTYPLLDRIYGLGLFDRGKSIAFAMDSLTNMYLDSVAMSIHPPYVYNRAGIDQTTLKMGPGALIAELIPNSLRQMNISPIGTNTYQGVSQALKAQLLNMAAATDTTVATGQDIEMGKTPEAIRQQRDRQGARDNWDRGMMEKFVEKVYSKMVTIMSKKQTVPIDIEIFDEDIQKIQEKYPDADLAVFDSGETGTLKVSPDELNDEEKSVKYKFIIDNGTTLRKDESIQNETLLGIINAYAGNPAIEQAMLKDGKRLNMAEVYKRFVQTSGVENPDKLFEDVEQDQAMTEPGMMPED
ncbi:MAG: hypothetical protein ACO3UU_04765, partial [Minisyncoccia bacterium]